MKTERALVAAPAVGQLSAVESERLAELELAIEKGIMTFIQVGKALLEIRDSRLYRASHSTFESYCRERWHWTRQHTNRVIRASGIAAELEPMGSISERALRPLASVPKAERPAVWAKAQELAGDQKVTARHVEDAAAPSGIPRTPEALAAIAALEMRLKTEAAERRNRKRADREAAEATRSEGTETPRDRLLAAIKVALIGFQNDTGVHGRPGPSARREVAFEVEAMLRAFRKGAL